MTTSLTTLGLTIARFTDLFFDMETAAKGLWGESVDTSDTQLLGHQMKQCSLALAEINQAFQEVADAQSGANVSGNRQDHLYAIVGLSRQAAAKSSVVITYTVDRATTIPAGHRVRTATNVTFQLSADYVFSAAGSADLTLYCTEYGAYTAAAGDVNVPVTSVYGLVSVTNAAAVVPGRIRETDPQFRVRHTSATATSGQSDTATIEEAVRAVDGVSDGVCIDDDDAHTITVSVIGGDDQDIAASIHNNRTGGIAMVGDQNVDYFDADTGQTKTISFYRAADRNFYLSATLARNTALFPADGEVTIREQMAALVANLRIMGTVDYFSLLAPFYSVAGITVSDLRIGWTSTPTGTANLTTTIQQRPALPDANITIAYTS